MSKLARDSQYLRLELEEGFVPPAIKSEEDIDGYTKVEFAEPFYLPVAQSSIDEGEAIKAREKQRQIDDNYSRDCILAEFPSMSVERTLEIWRAALKSTGIRFPSDAQLYTERHHEVSISPLSFGVARDWFLRTFDESTEQYHVAMSRGAFGTGILGLEQWQDYMQRPVIEKVWYTERLFSDESAPLPVCSRGKLLSQIFEAMLFDRPVAEDSGRYLGQGSRIINNDSEYGLDSCDDYALFVRPSAKGLENIAETKRVFDATIKSIQWEFPRICGAQEELEAALMLRGQYVHMKKTHAKFQKKHAKLVEGIPALLDYSTIAEPAVTGQIQNHLDKATDLLSDARENCIRDLQPLIRPCYVGNLHKLIPNPP